MSIEFSQELDAPIITPTLTGQDAGDQILAKPGMGVDEGYMIVYNEMQRILALRRAKQNRAQ